MEIGLPFSRGGFVAERRARKPMNMTAMIMRPITLPRIIRGASGIRDRRRVDKGDS
jgi:hypothetical protein